MTAPGALTGRYSAPGAVRALRLRASLFQFPADAGEGGADPFGTSGHRHPCHPRRDGGFRLPSSRRLFPPRPRQSPIVAGQQIQHRPAGSSPRRGRQAGARAALPGRPTARAPGASRPYHHAQSVKADRSPTHSRSPEIVSRASVCQDLPRRDMDAETVRLLCLSKTNIGDAGGQKPPARGA